MIDYTIYRQIHELHTRDHLTPAQIATALALDERTVRFWLDETSYRPRRGNRRASKLDGFKPDIARWLEQHAYTASQLLRRLRESGYTGGYSILKDYVRQVRPTHVTPHLTLGFSPGECAQVDWGSTSPKANGIGSMGCACSAGFSKPASPSSKPSTSSTGSGPRGSIAFRSRTSSAWPS